MLFPAKLLEKLPRNPEIAGKKRNKNAKIVAIILVADSGKNLDKIIVTTRAKKIKLAYQANDERYKR